MHIDDFVMERWQSVWENKVRFNLAESGVHPVRLSDLIPSQADAEGLFKSRLSYGETNGTGELREMIAGLYPGSSLDNITVTNGSAEANFVVIWMLLEPGDEMALMMPNYMQVHGLAESLGATVRPFWLQEERNWAPDLDELEAAVSSKTRVIGVCNPNNPTGALLSEEEVDRVVDIARRSDAWLLVDEVYRGAERDGTETPGFWGRYEKTIVNGGLSKAYGVPGLRIGWIVSSESVVERAWARRDYTTISPGVLSDYLARVVLRPENRKRLLARTRGLIEEGVSVLGRWVQERRDIFSWVEPVAGAIGYLRYRSPIDSEELAERCRRQSVLVVPGSQFEMDNFLRIGLGCGGETLQGGLDAIDRCFDRETAVGG